MSVTNYICLGCRAINLSYDFLNNTYKCFKCGKEYSSEQIVDKAKMSKHNQKKEKTMSNKGACVVCERDDVAIVGHGFCSACYGIGRKLGFDVDVVKAFRVEHPICKGRGRKSKKEKVVKVKKDTQVKTPKVSTIEKGTDVTNILSRYMDNRDSYSEKERDIILKCLESLL